MWSASVCCFLAAIQFHSCSIGWETLVTFGFGTNPLTHRIAAAYVS